MPIINDGRITAKLPKTDQERHEARAARLGIKNSEYVRLALELAEPKLETKALRADKLAAKNNGKR